MLLLSAAAAACVWPGSCPDAVRVLTGFTPSGGYKLISARIYRSFVLRFLLVFGIAFLLPVVLVGLKRPCQRLPAHQDLAHHRVPRMPVPGPCRARRGRHEHAPSGHADAGAVLRRDRTLPCSTTAGARGTPQILSRRPKQPPTRDSPHQAGESLALPAQRTSVRPRSCNPGPGMPARTHPA